MEAMEEMEDVVKRVRLRKYLKRYQPRPYKQLKKQMKKNEPLGDRIDLAPMIELLYYIYEKEKASNASGE